MTGTVADICANGKCNWFGLPGGRERLSVKLCKTINVPQKAVKKCDVFKMTPELVSSDLTGQVQHAPAHPDLL